MGLLGTMVVRFSADITGLTSGITQAESSVSGFGSSAASALGPINTVFALAGAAAIGMGAASVSAAADFQASTTKIASYAGLSGQALDDMKNSLMQMATQVGQSPTALADALYPIVSAGYAASDALNILKLSAETAAASGANTTVVADGLTTVLKAFNFPARDAGNVMDVLNQSVANAKTTFPELSAVIGKLSLSAASAHVPFVDMNAALDVLTTHGFPSVAQASTALGDLFTQMSVKTDALAAHAKALGITGFDAAKFAAMSLSDKISYLNQVTGGNQAELLKLLGGSTLALKAFNALKTGAADYTTDLNLLNTSQGKTAQVFANASATYNQALARMGAAFDVLKISIGNALLPVLTDLMSKITPIITAFATWISNSDNLKNLLQILAPIIAGVVVTAFTLWAVSAGAAAVATIAATWPVLAIAAAIGVLVGAFVALYNNSAPFRAFIQGVGSALQQVWQFLVASFIPIWQLLQQVWQNQIIPAVQQMQAAIAPLMPQLQMVGQIIVGVVGVAFTILMGIIGGVIGFLGGVFTGFTVMLTGITTFIAGIIQFWSSLFQFFIDLFTGKWDQLGTDLGNIWGGIVKMFQGVWLFIEGIFIGAINGIIGLVNGFLRAVMGPINFVLGLAHQGPISAPQIPLLAAPGGVPGGNAPGYQSPTKSATPAKGASATLAANPNIAHMATGGNPYSGGVTPASPTAPATNMSQALASPLSSTSTPTTAAVKNANGAASARHQQAQAAAAARHQAAQQHHQQVLAAHAARQKQAAQHHQAVLAAAAQRHQHVLAAHTARQQQAAQHHQQVLAAAATRHQQHMQTLTGIHQTLKQKSAASAPAVSVPATSLPVMVASPTSGAAGGSSSPVQSSDGGSGTTGGAQPLIIIVDLQGKELVKYVGDTMAKTVRLRTGMKV